MLAENLRHVLGDLSNENVEVLVECHGVLYKVARHWQWNDDRIVLVTHNYSVPASPSGSETDR